MGRTDLDGRVVSMQMLFVIDTVSLDKSVLPTFRGSFLPPFPESNKLKMKGSCRKKKLYLSSDVNVTDLELGPTVACCENCTVRSASIRLSKRATVDSRRLWFKVAGWLVGWLLACLISYLAEYFWKRDVCIHPYVSTKEQEF